MASSQRDVELVIKARDEATKALGTITEALNNLAQSQAHVEQTGQNTGTTLDKLGQSLDGMKRKAEGLAALGSAVTQIEKAGTAVERLDQQVANASERLGKSKSDYSALAESIETLGGKSAQIKEAMASEEAAFKATQLEAAGLEAQIKKLGDSLPRGEAGMRRSATATEAQRLAFHEAQTAIVPLVLQFEQLEARLKGHKDALTNLSKEQGQVNSTLGASQKVYSNLAREIERNAAAEADAVTRAGEAKAAYTEMQDAAGRAATVLGGVALNTEAVSAASRSAAETVRQLNAEMAKQPQVVAAQQSAGSATPRQELMAAKDAVAQSQQVWQQASAAIAALNAEIKAAGPPSQEMAAKMLLAKEAAAQAKVAWEQDVATLGKVRERVREYIADAQQQRTASVGAAQAARELAEAEERMNSLDWSSQNVELSRLQKLKIEWQELTGAVKNHISTLVEARTVETETAVATNSVEESMGYLKSQVLGLSAAYIGLFGAMNAVKGIIDTYRTLEQAQAQLVAAHGGDQHAAASDMIFLRGEAERLGLSLQDVAKQYGMLSVAATQNNVSQGTTRELFNAVAESARVVGLDSEKTSNVLYGFVRMIDVGKLQMRDFRSVMMLIPGAQAAMDQALDQTSGKFGVTTAEMRKMMRSAEGITVTDDLLKAWADNMEKRVGDKLPYALKTFNAEWGRFQTELQETQQLAASAGFMDALAFQLHRMNEFLKSDDGKKFFQELGHSLATLVNILGAVAAHIGFFKLILEAVIAVKIGKWVFDLSIMALALGKNIMLAADAMIAFGSGMTDAAGAAAMLDGALGGIPLLIGAVVFGLWQIFGNAAMGVGKLDEALDTHDRLISKVQDSFNAAGDSADKFKASLEGLSKQELLSGRQDLILGIDKANSDLTSAVNGRSFGDVLHGRVDDGTYGQLLSLKKAYDSTHISAEAFREGLLRLKLADDKFAQSDMYDTLSKTIDAVIKGKKGVEDYNAVLGITSGNAQQASDGMKQLSLGLTDVGNAVPTGKLNEFSQALNDIKRDIPELAKAAEAYAKVEALRQKRQSRYAEINALPKDQQDSARAEADSLYNRAVADVLGGAAVEAAQSGDGSRFLNTARGRPATGGPQVWGFNTNAGGTGGRQTTYAEVEGIIRSLGGVITSEHRSYEQQAEAYRKFLNGTGPKAAKPGHSDHELDPRLGGAMDVRYTGGPTLDQIVAALLSHGIRAHEPQTEIDPKTGIRHNHFGWRNGGSESGGDGGIRASSEGDFVNKVLARNGVSGAGGSNAAAFSKYGSAIDGTKAEPGDIVLFKNKGASTFGHVGFFEGYADNGDLKVLVGGRGRPKEQTINAADTTPAFRRAQSPLQAAESVIANETAQEKFDREIAAETAKLREDTAALHVDARTLAGQQAVDRFKKMVADSGPTPEHPDAKRLVFSQAAETKVRNAALGLFDEKQLDEEGKKLEQIQHSWNEILHAADKVSANERALQELRAKGFRFDANGKPLDKPSSDALATQVNIETHRDRKQDVQDVSGKFSELTSTASHLKEAYAEGDTKAIVQDIAHVQKLNAEIKAGLPALIAYFKAMGDQKTVAELEKIRTGLEKIHVGLFDQVELTKEVGKGLTDTFGALAKGLAGAITGSNSLGDAFKQAGTAFLQFAGQFLLKIAEMILQAKILQLLNSTGMFGGGGLAGLLNPLAAVHHAGGVAGSGGASRAVNPAVFMGALRMHTGGIAGLAPDEVATILQKGEEVLTESSPRHIKNIAQNLSQGASRQQDIKIINALDSGHMMSEALNTTQGQRAMVNFIRSNSRAVGSALKG